jgi:hypothetical protein
MDFRLTADQGALAEAIDKLALQFEAKPTEFRGFALLGHELDKQLEDGQYFDIAQVPELGTLSAAMAVERLARVPFTAEFALSMLVRPQLPGEWPRPLAVIDKGRPGRFVASARTLIIIEADRIGLARPDPNDGRLVPRRRSYRPRMRTRCASGCVSRLRRRRAAWRTPPSRRPSIISPSVSSSVARSAPSKRCGIEWPSAPCSQAACAGLR